MRLVHIDFCKVFAMFLADMGNMCLVCNFVSYRGSSWIDKISKYGKYTLVFYTMSFVLNAFLRRVMWHIGIYINTPGVLDLIAIIVAFAMMTLMF